MTEKDLLKLKTNIEKVKTDLIKLETKKQSALDKLKKDYKISSIKEAKLRVKKLEKSISELSKQITEITESIESKLKNE